MAYNTIPMRDGECYFSSIASTFAGSNYQNFPQARQLCSAQPSKLHSSTKDFLKATTGFHSPHVTINKHQKLIDKFSSPVQTVRPDDKRKSSIVGERQSPFSEYEKLGLLLRDNICSGWTNSLGCSTTSAVDYNGIIFKRRHYMTNEHRMHRDWLTIWAEDNVRRQSLQKTWFQTFDSNGRKKK